MLAVLGCGKEDCSECSRDLAQLCPTGKHHGIGQDGFYAEYVAIDVRAAIPGPDVVPPEVAAVAIDAVTTAYYGIVRRAEVGNSETVFLFGLDGLYEKLQAAAELGVSAEDIVPVGTCIQDFVTHNDLQGGMNTVLGFVGSNQTFRDAQNIVRPGGKILCIGTGDRQNQLDMKIGIRKRLSIIFSYGGQCRDLVEVLDLIAKGIIRPQVETRGLRDLPGVLEDLGKDKIRNRVALVNL
ncbi:hypothetical protein N8T08_007186 [Aspergillus melleus]|uniref:Uncharacterized protein n=1 Tax=Aspergillus melleus TaxID=138277 RepID=A0ACC3AYJ4_9EURO|nr:hypothetical protein N8T08_007186 [Aspergillus melleus]